MEIDFNPQPQNSPFGYLSQGLSSGIDIGLGFQRAKLAADQNARQQQELEMQRAAKMAQDEQEKQKMKLLEFGQLSELYSKTKNPKLKQQIYLDTIRPAAKVAFGADLPEEYDNSFDEDLDAFGELTQQFSSGKIKDQDFQKRGLALYANAVKRGEMEAAASIQAGLRLGGDIQGADGTSYQNEKIAEQRNRAAERIVTGFNADPIVRKHASAVEFSSVVKDLVASGNPIAAASIQTYMARASGEVGALTEADKAPFGGSRAIFNRLEQSLKQMADGRLTEDNAKFLSDLADTMAASANRRLDSIARTRAAQFSNANKQYIKEELFSVMRPDSVNVSEPKMSPAKQSLKDKLGL